MSQMEQGEGSETGKSALAKTRRGCWERSWPGRCGQGWGGLQSSSAGRGTSRKGSGEGRAPPEIQRRKGWMEAERVTSTSRRPGGSREIAVFLSPSGGFGGERKGGSGGLWLTLR